MSTRILIGDCRDVLASLPDQSVHCCITSPPYWGLRRYTTGEFERVRFKRDVTPEQRAVVESELLALGVKPR